jgi:hypothetical protein
MYEALLNAGICYGIGLLLLIGISVLMKIATSIHTFPSLWTIYNVASWGIAAPAFITGTLLLVQAFLI